MRRSKYEIGDRLRVTTRKNVVGTVIGYDSDGDAVIEIAFWPYDSSERIDHDHLFDAWNDLVYEKIEEE